MNVIYRRKCAAYLDGISYTWPFVEITLYDEGIEVNILSNPYKLKYNEIKDVVIKRKLWIKGIFFIHDSNEFPQNKRCVSKKKNKVPRGTEDWVNQVPGFQVSGIQENRYKDY